MHTCPHCRSTNLVAVALTLATGPVRFASCRACEHRWWTDAAAGGLSLGDVLDRVAA